MFNWSLVLLRLFPIWMCLHYWGQNSGNNVSIRNSEFIKDSFIVNIFREFRTSREAIEFYKSVQKFGNTFSDTFILGAMFLKIILFTCLVLCVYNTIICNLPLLPYLLMPLTVIACSTVYIFCFPPLCGLYEHSKECIRKWRSDIDQSTQDRKEWRCSGQSR